MNTRTKQTQDLLQIQEQLARKRRIHSPIDRLIQSSWFRNCQVHSSQNKYQDSGAQSARYKNDSNKSNEQNLSLSNIELSYKQLSYSKSLNQVYKNQKGCLHSENNQLIINRRVESIKNRLMQNRKFRKLQLEATDAQNRLNKPSQNNYTNFFESNKKDKGLNSLMKIKKDKELSTDFIQQFSQKNQYDTQQLVSQAQRNFRILQNLNKRLVESTRQISKLSSAKSTRTNRKLMFSEQVKNQVQLQLTQHHQVTNNSLINSLANSFFKAEQKLCDLNSTQHFFQHNQDVSIDSPKKEKHYSPQQKYYYKMAKSSQSKRSWSQNQKFFNSTYRPLQLSYNFVAGQLGDNNDQFPPKLNSARESPKLDMKLYVPQKLFPNHNYVFSKYYRKNSYDLHEFIKKNSKNQFYLSPLPENEQEIQQEETTLQHIFKGRILNQQKLQLFRKLQKQNFQDTSIFSNKSDLETTLKLKPKYLK